MKLLLAWSAFWMVSISWAGPPDGGPPGLNQKPTKVQAAGVPGSIHMRFGDDQRRVVRDYYAPQIRSGQCPPGLAKKNNGCQPPGLIKAWRVGQPLPGGVVVYPLPRDLERRLGTAPAGHKYVRAAADILLIAIGTSMVIDAIEDLAGL